MKFGGDFHGHQRRRSNDFGDPLVIPPVPPSGHRAAVRNKQKMKDGALSDWQMVFRKFRAETPQHLAFETLMKKKKRFENEGRREKVPLSENLERSSSALYPHLHANPPVGDSHVATAARGRRVFRCDAMGHLCNIFGSAAAQQ